MNDGPRLVFEPLSAEPARVLAFACDDQLGRPFVLSVYVEASREVGRPGELVGRPGTLLAAGSTFTGVVFEAHLLLAVERRTIYRLVLGPALRYLEMGLHSRVFVERSVPQILEYLLHDNGVADYELRLGGAHGKRRHICQYKESDLAFLHRWMEREGIYYYTTLQEGVGAKLVITDDRARHDDMAAEPVRYLAGSRSSGIAGSFHSWTRTHRAVERDVAIGDYDYQKPEFRLRHARSGVATGSEEYVRFEDNVHDQAEVHRATTLHTERLRARQVGFRGVGNVRGLHAGLRFALDGHPRHDFNRRYQVCRIQQRWTELGTDIDLQKVLGLEPADEVYRVDVEALADDVQYRPSRRTAWPEIHGVESAVVDGDADSPYAQLDGHGRYRARFRFDEEASRAGSASAWLRMAQPHGGAPEGFHFPLRKGTEVLTAFVHGDPDRPFILGTAPTATTQSVVTASNHTQNVVQTGGRTRVEIEDREGQRYIDLSTPVENTFVHLGAHAGLGERNLVVSTTGHGLENSGGNRDISVGGNQTEDVTGSVAETYSGHQVTQVHGSLTEVVQAGKAQSIASGVAQTVDGGVSQTIQGGAAYTVTGAINETIRGGRSTTVVGPNVESIGGSLQKDVGGAFETATSGSYSLRASGNITMMTPGAAKLEGTAGVKIIAPGGHLSVDSFLDTVGEGNKENFLLKGTAFGLRVLLHVNWLRAQAMQISLFGVKGDAKAGSFRHWVKNEELYGVLHARVIAVENKKSGVTTIGPGGAPTAPTSVAPPAAPPAAAPPAAAPPAAAPPPAAPPAAAPPPSGPPPPPRTP